jgi:hypothetical protein
MVRGRFCPHVAVLRESASILFGGGFPRKQSAPARKAAQRAIYHVQVELETLAALDGNVNMMLCDRGTLDGIAYWPGSPESFLKQVGTTRERELLRYHAVIHLRTPSASDGFNHQNRLRIENAHQAHEIDRRIAEAWQGHPRRFFVESSRDFAEKVARALALVEAELPPECRDCQVSLRSATSGR